MDRGFGGREDQASQQESGMASADGEQLLTVQEVAAKLKLNPETVRRWLREGRLRGVKFGRRGGYRVSEAEVQRLLAEGT